MTTPRPLPAPERRAASAPLQRPARRRLLCAGVNAVLVGGLLPTGLSGCGGGDDPGATPDARMDSLDNFRDVAGALYGHPTSDGRRMRRGLLYRAGVLSPDAADAARLAALGLQCVYDLRTREEAAAQPDTLPGGVLSQRLSLQPFYAATDLPASADLAVQSIQAAQRALVRDAPACAQLRSLLSDVAVASGALVIHGEQGLHRTGWVAALLLAIAGVPWDVMLQDYLASNGRLRAWQAKQSRAMALAYGDAAAQACAPFWQAQAAYLQAGFDAMQDAYGSLDTYLTRGLGLDDTTVERLRSRLVS